MNRILTNARHAALALVLALGPLGAAMAAEMPLLLKPRAVIDGDGLYLSDLFVNLPAERDSRLADAPAPGERMVIGARTLWRYAKAFKLNWRPRSKKTTATVVRDSRSVPREVVESVITAELARTHVTEDFDIALHVRDLKLFVAAEADTEVQVNDLRYDPRSKRFEARVSATNSDKQIVVSGKVQPMVDMPVLRRHMMPGNVIAEKDIEWRRVSARRVTIVAVTRLEDLVGYLPRRPLAAGQPIRLTDLKPDIVVRRRDLVTVQFRTSGMSLSTRGEALRDGARGDIIQVRNSHSRKVIEARVVGPDTVEVLPPQTAALTD